jgi:hypothetical protein
MKNRRADGQQPSACSEILRRGRSIIRQILQSSILRGSLHRRHKG